MPQLDQLFQTVEHTPREEIPALLDFHIKPTMRNGKSYIKVCSNFINKIRYTHSLPWDGILGTVDVAGLHSPIPYKTGLKALR